MRKILTATLSLALLAALALPVLGADTLPLGGNPLISPAPTQSQGYTIQVDGQAVTSNVQIMVPLAAVAKALGYQVTWNDGTVLVDNGVHHTNVQIGVDSYIITTSNPDLVGMSAPFSLGAVPYVSDGVSYVSLSLFDKLLGREGAVTVNGGVISINTQADDVTQLVNPFVDCDTLAQAGELAGFTMTVPQADDAQRSIQAIRGQMIQVMDQKDDETLRVRKAVGSDDVSGDYSAYAQTQTVTVDGRAVTMKGDSGMVSLATWTQGGYSFSVSVSAARTAEAMTQLIRAIG